MNIDVFGLGYVGVILIACLSSSNKVFGYDVDSEKIKLISQGVPPIDEPGLEKLLIKNNKNIKVKTSFSENEIQSNIGFLCVGTPYREGIGLDFQYIYRVIDSICIKILEQNRKTPYLIVIRSTANSKLMLDLSDYINTKYNLIKKSEVILCLFPEFLREGNAINDFFEEGSLSIFSSQIKSKYIEKILSKIFYWNKPKYVDLDSCAQIKLISNSWHSLKVAFTNETSQILKFMGVDSREAFKIFCDDQKLNISPAYMKPGFAYGGSCLTKDLSGLISLGKEAGIQTPLLKGIQSSNNAYINRVRDDIMKKNYDQIIIFGITFKDGTDDLRESPYLLLAKKLPLSKIKIADEIISKKLKDYSLSRGNQILIGNLKGNIIDLSNIEKNLSENYLLIVSHYKYFKFIEENFPKNSTIINLTHKKSPNLFVNIKEYV